MWEQFDQAFRNVKRQFDDRSVREPGLVCKQGRYGGSVVLKLQKPSWTNDSMGRTPNRTGIFFSIWLGKDDARKNKVNYNIHALKLRELKGYQLTSRAFAAAFREAFHRVSLPWPNVSIDYGPTTLMQGWIPINADSGCLERDLLDLLCRFEEVTPIIDHLLAQRVAPRTAQIKVS